MNERGWGRGAVVHRRAAPGRFAATRANAVQVAESHWTVWEQVQDVGSANSWYEVEKRNLMHDIGEREQQEGWAEKHSGGGEDTCDCDSERHSNPWSRAGGTGDVQPQREQSRWRWKRSGMVRRCREMASTGVASGAPIAVEAWSEGEGSAGREGGGEAAALAMR